MSNFNNIPTSKIQHSTDATVQTFTAYYSQPITLNANSLTAMTGFFASRGFDESSASKISVTIQQQAKKDGYNPMQILDTLRGLDNVEISALVSEILNYNRFKTSFLGYALAFQPHAEVLRNIQV